VIDKEPPGVLAGVIVLSDGANNAGLDPAAAAAALVRSRVPVHTVGIGSDTLPPNVRVADLLAPARVFPGDRFSVTGYVQAQGLAGRKDGTHGSIKTGDAMEGLAHLPGFPTGLGPVLERLKTASSAVVGQDAGGTAPIGRGTDDAGNLG
jgi:hypothetical protein